MQAAVNAGRSSTLAAQGASASSPAPITRACGTGSLRSNSTPARWIRKISKALPGPGASAMLRVDQMGPDGDRLLSGHRLHHVAEPVVGDGVDVVLEEAYQSAGRDLDAWPVPLREDGSTHLRMIRSGRGARGLGQLRRPSIDPLSTNMISTMRYAVETRPPRERETCSWPSRSAITMDTSGPSNLGPNRVLGTCDQRGE